MLSSKIPHLEHPTSVIVRTVLLQSARPTSAHTLALQVQSQPHNPPRCLSTPKPKSGSTTHHSFSKPVPQQCAFPLFHSPDGDTDRSSQTRITTKYTITPPPSAEALAKRRSKRTAQQTTDAAGAPAPPTARAVLELKTYDPESGVVLKYRTDKAAEVGRLIGSLGRMGRLMGGMEAGKEDEEKEDVIMGEAGEEEAAQTTTTATGSTQTQTQQGQAQQGGGGKKKKKGKR